MDVTLQNRNQGKTLFVVFTAMSLATATSLLAWGLGGLELKWAVYCLLGLLFPFVLAMVKDGRRFLLGLTLFCFPLNADINFIWHPSPGGANTISLGLMDILLLILAGFWLVRSSSAKMPGEIRFFPHISWPTLTLIFFALISMFVAQDLLWSLFDVINFFKAWLFFFILANNIRGRDDLYLVTSALFLGLLVQAVFVGLQFYKGSNLGLASVGLGEPNQILAFEMKAGNVPRPGGTIGHCNHLARYVGLLLPVSITLSLTHSSRKMRLFTGLVSVAGLLSLLYTLTRSAWIGLFVSIAVIGYYLFVRGHLNLHLIGKIGFAVLLFVLLVISYRSLIIGRVMDYDFGSAKTRLTTARVALKIIGDHPFLGVGINNYGTVLETYWDAEDTFTRRTAVHNAYLLIAAEIGLLGFGSFIWILAAAYTRIRRAIRLRARELSILAIGIMGAFSGFLVTALSDKSHKESYILLFVFWALLAIIEAVIRYGESAAEEARV